MSAGIGGRGGRALSEGRDNADDGLAKALVVVTARLTIRRAGTGGGATKAGFTGVWDLGVKVAELVGIERRGALGLTGRSSARVNW